jgi:hypothetical protein
MTMTLYPPIWDQQVTSVQIGRCHPITERCATQRQGDDLFL